jgi:hypothetical protein
MPKPTGSVTKRVIALQTHLLSLEDPIEGFQPQSDEELKKLRDGIEALPTNTNPVASSNPPQVTP